MGLGKEEEGEHGVLVVGGWQAGFGVHDGGEGEAHLGEFGGEGWVAGGGGCAFFEASLEEVGWRLGAFGYAVGIWSFVLTRHGWCDCVV